MLLIIYSIVISIVAIVLFKLYRIEADWAHELSVQLIEICTERKE